MVAFDSICVRECPIGRYAVNNICQGKEYKPVIEFAVIFLFEVALEL